MCAPMGMGWFGGRDRDPPRADWQVQMDVADREEQVLLDLQALRDDRDRLAHENVVLDDRCDALERDRERLTARVRYLEDAMQAVTGDIEKVLVEELPVEQVARTLLRRLDAAFGFERLDDTMELHDIFSAMRELSFILETTGPLERGSWLRAVLKDAAYNPEENECPRAKRIAPEPNTKSSG